MSAAPDLFRIAIVPGVTVTRWTRAWDERRRDTPLRVTPIDEADQRAALIEQVADLAFVRLPIERDELSVIRLYSEVAVVIVPKEHPIAAFDSIVLADLAGEVLRQEPVEDAIDLVVAGVGVVVLPQSIARQHARKDLVSRPITDAPETEIAIAWLAENTTPDIEEFVGIVRGRTASSSRGPIPEAAKPPAGKPKPRRQSPARPKAPTRTRKPRGKR